MSFSTCVCVCVLQKRDGCGRWRVRATSRRIRVLLCHFEISSYLHLYSSQTRFSARFANFWFRSALFFVAIVKTCSSSAPIDDFVKYRFFLFRRVLSWNYRVNPIFARFTTQIQIFRFFFFIFDTPTLINSILLAGISNFCIPLA